jgi:hypothetical protein
MNEVPAELNEQLHKLVSQSALMLKLMQGTDKTGEFYKRLLQRFRRCIVEASNRMDTIRYFVPTDKYDELLKSLDCSWDDKAKRLKLPDAGMK